MTKIKISVSWRTGETLAVKPVKIMPSRKLAVHPMVLADGELSEHYYTATHIPTGWQVVRSRIEQPLDHFLLIVGELDKLDWDFSEPCQLPAKTFQAAHALLDGKYSLPGYSDDFKQVCFAEPKARP
jgi:hypothetical protein